MGWSLATLGMCVWNDGDGASGGFPGIWSDWIGLDGVAWMWAYRGGPWRHVISFWAANIRIRTGKPTSGWLLSAAAEQVCGPKFRPFLSITTDMPYRKKYT